MLFRTSLRATTLRPFQFIRLSSTTTNPTQPTSSKAKSETSENKKPENSEAPTPKKKTMAQLDEELRQKMSGLAGDGGEAGVELEGGQPVSMKRSVRENMFRYI